MASDDESSDFDGDLSQEFRDACERGPLEEVAELLSLPNLNPNAGDATGLAGFHLACAQGRLDVIKLLLSDFRVDPNARDRRGRTALHRAAECVQLDAMLLLLDHPDRVASDLLDIDGRSAFDLLSRSQKAWISENVAARKRAKTGPALERMLKAQQEYEMELARQGLNLSGGLNGQLGNQPIAGSVNGVPRAARPSSRSLNSSTNPQFQQIPFPNQQYPPYPAAYYQQTSQGGYNGQQAYSPQGYPIQGYQQLSPPAPIVRATLDDPYSQSYSNTRSASPSAVSVSVSGRSSMSSPVPGKALPETPRSELPRSESRASHVSNTSSRPAPKGSKIPKELKPPPISIATGRSRNPVSAPSRIQPLLPQETDAGILWIEESSLVVDRESTGYGVLGPLYPGKHRGLDAHVEYFELDEAGVEKLKTLVGKWKGLSGRVGVPIGWHLAPNYLVHPTFSIPDFAKLGHDESLKILRDVSAGLAEIHGHGLLHGALSVLAIGQGKLANPGLASLRTSAWPFQNLDLDSLRYAAPEFFSDVQPGPPADIWSLGILLLQFLTGNPPFQESRSPLALLRVILDFKVPERPDGVDEKLWDLVARSLSIDPAARPAASEVHAVLDELVYDPDEWDEEDADEEEGGDRKKEKRKERGKLKSKTRR